MVTDAMLKDAALAADEVLLSSLAADREMHIFSERFEKKIKKLFERVRNPFRYYTKRIVPAAAGAMAILFCISMLMNPKLGKFKRISFSGDAVLGDEGFPICNDAVVINRAKDPVPLQVPIYKITERKFTANEFSQMKNIFNLSYDTTDDWMGWKMDGNKITGRFERYSDGVFTMTEEELEARAWETLKKIPFLDGEYEYVGITGEIYTSSSTETITHCVRVTFRLLLDGMRVTGNDRCEMWFNDHGLMEICLQRYTYKQIGTMDLIPLADAETQIKTPDSYGIDIEGHWFAKQLEVEHVRVQLVNQYSRGCTILQPVYKFTGTATLRADDREVGFYSIVIAIPESYTYD